mgnify:CR=1 FL=1
MIAAPDAVGAAPPIALGSNARAHGPSPHAAEAARRAVTGIERYPEAPDRLLAPAIAARYGLDPARIVCGQGSDDLLARTARARLGPGDELIRSANGYLTCRTPRMPEGPMSFPSRTTSSCSRWIG